MVDFGGKLWYNQGMENVNDNVKQNLIYLRKKKKLTQIELADAVQYSDKTVSKWETGESVPNIETLVRLASFYGVSLDALVKGNVLELEGEQKQKQTIHSSKIVITLLSVVAVWVIATIVFVSQSIISQKNVWQLFVCAVPASCVVFLVFNSIWGNRRCNYLIISVFLWSLLASFHLCLLKYQLHLIYVIGAPVQIVIILWSYMKRPQKAKKEKEIKVKEKSPKIGD